MKVLGLTATMLVIWVSLAFAQGIDIQDSDTSRWPEVSIRAILPSDQERPDAYTLKILPDGVAFPASAIQADTRPILTSIVVVLDTSKSMDKRNLEAFKKALLIYVENLGEDEQLAAYSFEDRVSTIAEFETDIDLFRSSLDTVQLDGTITELYKAMDFGLDRLKDVAGRRVLLVISDGKDEGKDLELSQVIQVAKERDIKIFAIGLPNKREKDFKRYLDIMEKFSLETGGEYTLAKTPEDLQMETSTYLFTQQKIAAVTQKKQFILRFMMDAPAPKANIQASLMRKVSNSEVSAEVQLAAVLLDPLPAKKEQVQKSTTLLEKKAFWIVAGGVLLLLIGGTVFVKRKTPIHLDVLSPNPEKNRTDMPLNPLPIKPGNDKAGAENFFILEFPLQGQSYTLTEGTVRLGAEVTNDICLNESTVSRSHAEFYISGKKCAVKDLNSTNGIFLNGERITQEMVLNPGDKLQFGRMEATLRYIQQAGRV